MYYHSTFDVKPPRGSNPRQTLDRLRQVTELSLGLQTGQFTVEDGQTEEAAFWEINLERPITDESGNLARLEVRAFQHRYSVRTQLVSRYLHQGAQGTDELPTFPPNLLRSIIAEFQCYAGPTLITQRHSTVNQQNAARFISDHIQNPARTLPILVITDGHEPNPADPITLQRSILGAGHVAVIHRDAEQLLQRAIKRATYGGKMRLISPRLTDNHPFYHSNPDRRALIERCLSISTDPGFDAPFAKAVHATNLRPSPTTATSTTLSGPNLPPTPDPQHAEITKLHQASQQMQARIRQLEQELSQQAEARRSSADDHSRRRRRTAATIVIGDNHTANVTAMNHALNLVRDPLRRYVVRRIRDHFGTQADAKIAIATNPRFAPPPHMKASSENSIDINDLPNIVSNFQQCFNHDSVRATELARMLREIKAIRNRASHPPVGGISPQECVDKILTISRMLHYTGITDHQRQIRELITVT